MTSPDSQLERLRRGAVDLIDEADLARKLRKGPLTVKVGFDPSAPDIHLGHTVVLRKMRHFQDAGHRVVFVIGDFTAMIGDPSGKKATRPQLTREEIEANAETYTRQAFKILDAGKTVIEFNDRWLGALGSAGLRAPGRRASPSPASWSATTSRSAGRRSSRSRCTSSSIRWPRATTRSRSKADVELGGTDQLFNLLVGRDLMRAENLEPQVVMTLPLLVGIDGVEKMSKSLGNAIGVLDPPGEMFGKIMSIPDALLWSWYELLTDVPAAEIAARRRRVEEGGENPRDAKAELARRITADFHGDGGRRPRRGGFPPGVFEGRGAGGRRDPRASGRKSASGARRRSWRSSSRRPCARRAARSPRAR